MASDLYCTRADVTSRLPPGAITSPTGILASCLASSDVLTYDGHGLETGDAVTVRAADAGTLSAPLAVGTTYYAIRVSNAAFQLAATNGGAAINITSNGVEMIVTREPRFDDLIEFVSRWADGLLVAHAVPLTAPMNRPPSGDSVVDTGTVTVRPVLLRSIVVVEEIGRSIVSVEFRIEPAPILKTEVVPACVISSPFI